MAQKIVQYQAVFQLAQAAPNLYNMPMLHRQMLDVLGINDAHKLVPIEDDLKPTDPITENQNVLRMKPLKAFAFQDHRAHIAVHMSAMQDPMIQQLLKNNPAAQQMMAAMMSHLNEHIGFQYRNDIQEQLGMTLPPQFDESGEEVQMDPEVEARLAPMLAQAAQRLLMKNQAQMAQQQAQQQAQDPLVQMQMQELQLKAQEQQRKAQKDSADNALKVAQLQIERQRIAAQQETAQMQQRNDLMKTAAEMSNARDMEIAKTGVDVLKHMSETVRKREDREAQERAQLRSLRQPPAKKG